MLTLITTAILAIGVPVTLILSLFIREQHTLLTVGLAATAVVIVAGGLIWRWMLVRGSHDVTDAQPWLRDEPVRDVPVESWSRLRREAEAAAAEERRPAA
jgi:hypothetical protein